MIRSKNNILASGDYVRWFDYSTKKHRYGLVIKEESVDSVLVKYALPKKGLPISTKNMKIETIKLPYKRLSRGWI